MIKQALRSEKKWNNQQHFHDKYISTLLKMHYDLLEADDNLRQVFLVMHKTRPNCRFVSKSLMVNALCSDTLLCRTQEVRHVRQGI